MRIVVLAILSGFAALMISRCGKDGQNTITGPETNLSSISGRIRHVRGNQFWSGVEVRLSGSGVDSTIACDHEGKFTFTGLGNGVYILESAQEEYSFAPDSVQVALAGSDVVLEDCYFIPESDLARIAERDEIVVFGRVDASFTNNGYQRDFTMCIDDAGGNRVRDVRAPNGNFYTEIPSGAYTLAPLKEGYAFAFTPSEIAIEPGKRLYRCIFRGEYAGGPLYSISGRVVWATGNPVYSLGMVLEDGRETLFARTDSLGVYIFQGLRQGTYTVRNPSSTIHMKPPMTEVAVENGDVVIPDFTASYIGPTYNRISGRIVDRAGRGIPAIKLATGYFQYIETDLEGAYVYGSFVDREKPEVTLSLRPEMKHHVFTPDSVVVTLKWLEGVHESSITVPDVVGIDYAAFTLQDYFPLLSTSYWTYARTVDGGEPFEHRVSVAGGFMHEGEAYQELSPAGPADFTVFRIEGEEVYTIFNERKARYLRFGRIPETNWAIGLISGKYAFTGTFLGLDDITVPAGTYTDCLKFEARKKFGDTSHETWTFWFAKGVGMVRSERILVNYGRVLETTTDVLKKYVL